MRNRGYDISVEVRQTRDNRNAQLPAAAIYPNQYSPPAGRHDLLQGLFLRRCREDLRPPTQRIASDVEVGSVEWQCHVETLAAASTPLPPGTGRKREVFVGRDRGHLELLGCVPHQCE